MDLKPGDRVDCRIKSSAIVGPYSSYDEEKTFEIVACYSEEYYLYVPHYWIIKDSYKADEYVCKKLNIDKRFLNEQIVCIEQRHIAKVHSAMDGMTCRICREFSQYAASNQYDGSFICFKCRANPYH